LNGALWYKVQILVRSLGLSKLYYACSKTGVRESFVKLVKSKVAKFVWNNKKPKIKYKTLIGNYEAGGINYLIFKACFIKQTCSFGGLLNY
jgi:hypothetical protein